APKEISNTAYQVFWKIDDSAEVQARVREESAVPRIWLLGGFIALLTLIVVAVAAYLRLDARTNGRFRIRLKLATTALIVAGGMLLTALIPVA
ncbi:MAG: hypothetical protein IID45_12090, partial [Planctomycetes bacterium]|nr:hypothetical protein [Planctomycetota bacterium]